MARPDNVVLPVLRVRRMERDLRVAKEQAAAMEAERDQALVDLASMTAERDDLQAQLDALLGGKG